MPMKKNLNVAIFKKFYYIGEHSYPRVPYFYKIGKKLMETENMVLVETEESKDIYESCGLFGMFERKTGETEKWKERTWFTKNGDKYSVETIKGNINDFIQANRKNEN